MRTTEGSGMAKKTQRATTTGEELRAKAGAATRTPRAKTPAPRAAKAAGAEKEARAEEVVSRLKTAYPDAGIVLTFNNDWELLVSVILSAQCTDKMVNQVTATLFRKYRTIEDYASADPAEFEADIRPTGFFRNKTKHIIGSAQKVLANFGGEVPASMVELLTLPGVARKTANIVLGNAHPEAYATDPESGIAVDTHVNRLSRRLGLVTSDNPNKIERELMAIIPRDDWFQLTYLLIEHGRVVCAAKRALCGECVLQDICPSAFKA
jgi:endonuclease-3